MIRSQRNALSSNYSYKRFMCDLQMDFEKERIINSEILSIQMEKRLLGLYNLSSDLALANSFEELYSIFSSALKKVLKFDNFALLIKEGNELKVVHTVGIYRPNFPLLMNGEKGITVACAREKKTIYVPDVTKDERYIEAAPHIRSEVAVPVLYRDELIGVIDVEKAEVDGFSQEDISLLEIFANVFAASFKNVEFKKKLEDSERKFRSIFENATEGIYRIDRNGRLIEANAALQKFFGYSEEELKKMDLSKLYKNPEGRKKFMKELFEKGSIKNYEVEYVRKDGKTITGNEYAVLVREDGKEFIDGIIHDVTQLKKAQKEAEFYNTLLRHDVANKLQLVMGYLEILLEKELDSESRELAMLAMRSARSAVEIIEKVRKLQMLKKGMERKRIELDELIEDIVDEYSKEAKKKSIEVDYRKGGKKVVADELLREAIANLVWNSIIHSGATKINIYTEENEDAVKIIVKDNGKGIPDEEKKKIFEMGYKGKESKGGGLGLYLVKKIVESMNGKVDVRNGVENGVTKGVRFEITIPK